MAAEDDDLDVLSREMLIEEVKRLRRGIRRHRDGSGQELCWHHPALWSLLPERTDPLPTVPEWPAFLSGCVRYRQSLDDQLPDAPRSSEELAEADPKLVALRFNQAINRRDLDGLVALMTADHRFVDTEGHEIRGRDAARAAWQIFFTAFPDYQNELVEISSRGGQVIAEGRSRCSQPALDGPALWTAEIRVDRVAQWRVHSDDASTRSALGRRPSG